VNVSEVFPLKQPNLSGLERAGYLPGLLAGLPVGIAAGRRTAV
jgi:hypothetical protein